MGGSRCGREPVRKIRLAKLDIVTNYKNTEKAGVIKVMRRKICDGIWGMGFGDAFEWMGFDLGSRDEGEEKDNGNGKIYFDNKEMLFFMKKPKTIRKKKTEVTNEEKSL